MNYVELRLGGSPVLLGRRKIFPPEVKAVDPLKRAMLLRRMSTSPDAIEAIRRGIDSLGLPVTARQLEDGELLRQIEARVERGQLIFVSLGTSASQLRPQPYRPTAAGPGAHDVSRWSTGEKIEEALRRCVRLLPGEIGDTVKGLLSPEAIVMTVGMLLAVVAANAMGVGVVLDAALAAYAFYAAGMSGLRALAEFVGATVGLVDARDEEDIDRAAAVYAATLTILGTVFLQRFIKAARRKAKDAGGSSKSDSGSSDSSRGEPRRDKGTETGKQTSDKQDAPPAKKTVAAKPGYVKPAPASMTNKEARDWYHSQEDRIPDRVDKNAPLDVQAKQAFEMRNEIRTDARNAMADRTTAEGLMKTDPNLSWDQIVARKEAKGLSGDAVFKDILESSTKSRTSVDEALGIKRVRK